MGFPHELPWKTVIPQAILLYAGVGLAFIPSGLGYAVLSARGVDHWAAALLLIALGLAPATVVWIALQRWLSKHTTNALSISSSQEDRGPRIGIPSTEPTPRKEVPIAPPVPPHGMVAARIDDLRFLSSELARDIADLQRVLTDMDRTVRLISYDWHGPSVRLLESWSHQREAIIGIASI